MTFLNISNISKPEEDTFLAISFSLFFFSFVVGLVCERVACDWSFISVDDRPVDLFPNVNQQEPAQEEEEEEEEEERY